MPDDATRSPEGLTPGEFRTKKFRGKEMSIPTQGFGPKGEFTIWLPTAAPKLSYTFKDGKPVRVVSHGVMGDKTVSELRDRVLIKDMGKVVDVIRRAQLRYRLSVENKRQRED